MADNDKKPTRRLVKNPETFRERALKSAEEKPKKRSLIKSLFRPIGKFFSLIGRLIKRVYHQPIIYKLCLPFRFIGKYIFPSYFRKSFQELKLVTWPNWKQSRDLTLAVLIFAVVFGASIALVDLGLDKAFKHLLLK